MSANVETVTEPAWMAHLAEAARHAVVPLGDGRAEIATDVVMPSGAGIVVVVQRGNSDGTVRVSDGGCALRHIEALGIEVAEEGMRSFRRAARAVGLGFAGDEVFLQPVSPQDLPWAISRTANASREIASTALRGIRRSSARQLKMRVQQQLARIFPSASISPRWRVPGKSETPHRFDYGIRLEGGRQLTLDLPSPEPNSVSTIVLRNLDVRSREMPGLVQVIAWDDMQAWSSETLDQLRLAGVSVIRASELDRELAGLAVGHSIPHQ